MMTNSKQETQASCKYYCQLEFVPSEGAVINAFKINGKCFIHCHLQGGMMVSQEWSDIGREITGPILYNNLKKNRFVLNHLKRIEKIVVSVHETAQL